MNEYQIKQTIAHVEKAREFIATLTEYEFLNALTKHKCLEQLVDACSELTEISQNKGY